MNTLFETKNAGNEAGKHEWYTPKYIIDGLKCEFITDPCAAPIEFRPFDIGTKNNFTLLDDGLNATWEGLVWCNPPYGKNTKDWLKKCSQYGNAIVLIFARTETKMFFDYVWGKASGIFFFQGRISFIDSEGKTDGPAGAPSVLIAYGEEAAEVLSKTNLKGKFVKL